MPPQGTLDTPCRPYLDPNFNEPNAPTKSVTQPGKRTLMVLKHSLAYFWVLQGGVIIFFKDSSLDMVL